MSDCPPGCCVNSYQLFSVLTHELIQLYNNKDWPRLSQWLSPLCHALQVCDNTDCPRHYYQRFPPSYDARQEVTGTRNHQPERFLSEYKMKTHNCFRS